MQVLQKSGCGGSSCDSIFMAGYAGLVQLLGGLVAGPGVSGGAHAVSGHDFVVHGVPEVLGVQLDALVVEPLVQDATGCPIYASLGQHFLQLKRRRSFTFSGDHKIKQLSKDKQNGAIGTHLEPLEGVLLSVISAVPYAQLPVTMEFHISFLYFRRIHSRPTVATNRHLIS